MPRTVGGEVHALDVAPVRRLVAFVVAVDRPHHARPRPLDDEEAALVRRAPDCRALSTTSALMPGSGLVALPGLVGIAPGSGEIMIAPVSVCHQVSTIGQRPPPMTLWYHIHASGLIGSPTVPSSRSDDRSCALRVLVAPLDEGADGRRRGVEDRDPVLLDDLPEAVFAAGGSARLRTSPPWRRWRAGRRRCSCARSPSRRPRCTSRCRLP